jgi:hypothetical protein
MTTKSKMINWIYNINSTLIFLLILLSSRLSKHKNLLIRISLILLIIRNGIRNLDFEETK